MLPTAKRLSGSSGRRFAQDDKVISVRLALFAEMVKGKPWTPKTLEEVGGTEGVGVTFLEETFSASTAPPQHRVHQKAAQSVLKALLPEPGSNIKGHMRSQQELLITSGYAESPKDFDELLRILDSEIRLITPTDPEGRLDHDNSKDVGSPAQQTQYYQLTHDYLVSSLQDWLTRKQKETRRGRARLLLEDRASVWNARPENRQLPSLLQWCQINWFTARKEWSPSQRKMMARAGRYHAVRNFMVVLLFTSLVFVGLLFQQHVRYERQQTTAASLVENLLSADTSQVPEIIRDIPPEIRAWTDPHLHKLGTDTAMTTREQLHVSLALLPVDETQVDYLYGRLLDAKLSEVPVIRDALLPHKRNLIDKLWEVVERPQKGNDEWRLLAAAALATYDPGSPRWAQLPHAGG